MQIIFTVQPESVQYGFNELYQTAEAEKVIKWLDAGVGILQIKRGFKEISEKLMNTVPVFVRHICPAEKEIEVSDNRHMEKLLENFENIKNSLEKTKTFSVQSRVFENIQELKKNKINNFLADKLIEQGFILNVQTPDQIVSLTFTDSKIFWGVSGSGENLSSWTGGEHRFKEEPQQISRAEFKLLEAMDIFNIKVDSGSKAVDLGASPGGWTRVLLAEGASVTAVDPADMHHSLKDMHNYKHIRLTAQEYFQRVKDGEESFDICVNDMRLDPHKSVSVMGEASKYLSKGGIAIMTLKLQEKNVQKTVKSAVQTLKNWYEIIGVKQLFHNRSEVTAVMRRKI